MTLEALNALPEAEARAALERCCAARVWVERMMRARPFRDRVALLSEAELAFSTLTARDWLEAFAQHPRIGDLASLRARFATTAGWAAAEQQGAASASEATLGALKEGNRHYERKFGHRFIVCASGKSAEEMLSSLESRLGNDPEHERAVAAGEQMKITRLRLEKLLEGAP